MEEFDIPCDPPLPAEIGDVWYCPSCARKYHYVLITIEDRDETVEAWMTTEIGF